MKRLPGLVVLVLIYALTGAPSAAQEPTTQEQAPLQPLVISSGVAGDLLGKTGVEFRMRMRQLEVSEPYLRLGVGDELLALSRGTAGYTMREEQIRRKPHDVLRELVEAWTAIDIDEHSDHADEATAAAYLSYKAGVIAQSVATRRAADTADLAQRYQPRILDGLKNFRSGPRGFRALQELLTVWPPLGATPDELRQVSGITGKLSEDGVITADFDNGHGLGSIGVRFIFVGGRLDRISYSPGA